MVMLSASQPVQNDNNQERWNIEDPWQKCKSLASISLAPSQNNSILWLKIFSSGPIQCHIMPVLQALIIIFGRKPPFGSSAWDCGAMSVKPESDESFFLHIRKKKANTRWNGVAAESAYVWNAWTTCSICIISFSVEAGVQDFKLCHRHGSYN